MKAVTWQGVHDMQVTEVPDPRIEEPTDAIIKVTSTGLCGSDLHLYETLAPFMEPGDIVGHEPMGIVEEVGSGVSDLQGRRPRRRAVQRLLRLLLDVRARASTASARPRRTTSTAPARASSATASSTARSPAARRSTSASRSPTSCPSRCRDGPADDRFLFLSDVLPTAWQGLQYADVPDGGTLLVLGAGPIGDMAARMGVHAGHRVISVDRVPERLARVEAFGAEPLNLDDAEDVGGVGDVVREPPAAAAPTPSSTPSAWRPTAPAARRSCRRSTGLLPDAIPEPMMKKAGLDRLAALHTAIDAVRRGGTISISGVYGGQADPMPMMQLFDKQIQVRMGQANVRRWTDELLAMLVEDDPFGVDAFATHHLPLDRGARRLRALPEEGGGHGQGGLPALSRARTDPRPARVSPRGPSADAPAWAPDPRHAARARRP